MVVPQTAVRDSNMTKRFLQKYRIINTDVSIATKMTRPFIACGVRPAKKPGETDSLHNNISI